MGELYIAEEAACWERKSMLFKVYLRQSDQTLRKNETKYM